MTAISCTYSLATANTYETPEKAIEGIEKETIAAAKNFSPSTRQAVEKSAKGYAETARLMITGLASEMMLKISRFPNAKEEETCRAIRQTWTTAETMREFCLDALKNGAYADTLKKVDHAKREIASTTFDQLAGDIYVAPAAPVPPKPLSQSLQKLQELNNKFGYRSRVPSF